MSAATIEAQYAVGFNWARQPQLRITKNWNKEFWAAVSIENPQTTFAGNAAAASGITVDRYAHRRVAAFNKANNFSLNHVPDVIGKMAWEPVIGDSQPLHMEVFGLYRDFYDRVNTAAVNASGPARSATTAIRAGGGVGGTITWSLFPKMLDLQVTAMTGSGIGRYGSGQLPDVTLVPTARLAPIKETTMLFGATWHVTPLLDIYAYDGQEAEHAKYFNVGTTLTWAWAIRPQSGGCVAATPKAALARPISRRKTRPMSASGGESIRASSAASASAMQYSYTHLTAFAGARAAPSSRTPTTAWSSPRIRYYPF